MKIKRIIAALCASAMLALTACSEDNGANVPANDTTATTAVTTQDTAATTTTTAATTTTEVTTAPKNNVNVNFQTYTYRFKDAQNYEYEVTLKLSPWILDTQSDVLDSAWAQVGRGKKMPTMSSMGAQKYANNVYTTRLSDSEGRTRTFYATMTNMYFSVGSASVRNITNGWDFSEQKPGGTKIAMYWVSDFTKDHLGNYGLMGKALTSSSDNTSIGEVFFRPKMTKNTWGPIPVVFAHAENISPRYPGGELKRYAESGYLLCGDQKITIPMYGSSSSPQTTTQAQTTTAASQPAPTGVRSAKDFVNLGKSVYYKDFDTAANTVAKSLNVKLGSYTDESYDMNDGRIYDQSSSKMNVMGVSMSDLSLEGFKTKPNRSNCGLIGFHMSAPSRKDASVTASKAKSAYDRLYKQFKATYGKPTSTIETTEAGSGEKSDYSKYYWVQWNIPSAGDVWLCWGKDLWEMKGYNDCILSISHPDRDKQ